MKIPRYLYGGNNVSLLSSQRSSALSPQEGAAAAARPYDAVASIAESASSIFTGINEENKRIERQNQKLLDEEDTQSLKLLSVMDKARLNAIQNDPTYDKQTQPDGEPTASKILNDVEDHFADQQQALSAIQNPKTRANAQEIMTANQDASRMWARSFANDKREKWATENDYLLYDVMVEGQAYDDARTQLDEMSEKGRIAPASKRALNNQIDSAENTQIVTEEVAKYEQQIAMDNGDQALSQAMANPNSDPKVQKAILAGIKAEMTNYNVINKQVKDSNTAKWMRETSNLITSLENPNITIDVESLYDTMLTTDLNPVKAATLANQVATAQRNRTTKTNKQDVFMEQLNAGYEFDNTQANQIGVDGYLGNQLKQAATDPEMADMSREEVEISTYRTTGLVGQRRQTEMQNASDAANIAQQAEFFNALHSNSYLQTEDGLNKEKRSLYERIAESAARGATSWAEATQTVMELRNVDAVEKQQRKNKFIDEDGKGKSEEAYRSLFDKKYDSDWPLYTGIDNVDKEQNEIRYQLYLQDGLDLYGNWPDAKGHADTLLLDSHVITNINGNKEMQVGGISAKTKNGVNLELSGLRQKFVNASVDEIYLITEEGGSSKLGKLEMEGTTFENPKEAFGATEYQVYSYGNPVINPATGLQKTADFNDSDIQELIMKQSASLDLTGYREGQAEIQKQINKLDAKIKRGEARNIDMAPEINQMRNLESGMMAKAKEFRDKK
jgi:hypothetical protein